MKRRASCLILYPAVMVTLLMGVLSGCISGITGQETAEAVHPMEAEIKNAYCETFLPQEKQVCADSLKVRWIYSFEGGCAVFIDGYFEYFEFVHTKQIGKYSFVFPTSQPLYIYSEHVFYTLQEAVEAGVLQGKALEQLYHVYNMLY